MLCHWLLERQRPSLASYVTVTGPTDGAPAPPEGGNVGYPLGIDSSNQQLLTYCQGATPRLSWF